MLNRDSGLYNEDLAPVPADKRSWSLYNYASLWVAMSVCIPTYMLASGLIAGGMNWWQAVGTILLGKLAMSELALGGTRAPAWGTTRNPWNPEHTPGESSSGSGAALGAHLCGASVGEDTGGSGRTPGAYCNAVGLRPTYTRVSRHGLMPACWFFDQAAPMTKTVEDCALVLGAIAGHDPKDPITSRRPVPDYRAGLGGDLRGVRVGLIRELVGHSDIHPEVKAEIGRAHV